MNDVLWQFLNKFVIIYFDNILIYSWKSCHYIKQVLLWLRLHHLYLELDKCKLYCSSFQFLGYVMNQD